MTPTPQDLLWVPAILQTFTFFQHDYFPSRLLLKAKAKVKAKVKVKVKENAQKPFLHVNCKPWVYRCFHSAALLQLRVDMGQGTPFHLYLRHRAPAPRTTTPLDLVIYESLHGLLVNIFQSRMRFLITVTRYRG